MIRLLLGLLVISVLAILSPANDSHDVLGRIQAAGLTVPPKLGGDVLAAAALSGLAREGVGGGIEAARELAWKTEPTRISPLRPTLGPPPTPPRPPAAR